MLVKVINRSGSKVLCKVENNAEIEIKPNSSEVVDIQPKKNFKISHDYGSSLEKKWYSENFNIVIDSEYIFEDIPASSEINIVTEKSNPYLNVFYDIFRIVNLNLTVINNHYYVSNREHIVNSIETKKRSRKSWNRWGLILGPIIHTPIRFGFLLLVGIVISFQYGYKFSIIYFSILYFSFFFAGLIGELLGKKIFGKDTTIEDIERYVSNEYISKHFS
jgi:hypothetical protein